MAVQLSAPVFALLTDFGSEDPYVGVMKGVLLSLSPSARIVDIAHNVTPQHVREGAFLLWSAYRWFPKGTVFICVVDPGVGTERELCVLGTSQHRFIGPDNGLLSFVEAEEPKATLTRVSHQAIARYSLKPTSATFHGRDIIAPLAAVLARPRGLPKLGRPVRRPRTEDPFVSVRTRKALPVILHIDRFGNIITNIRLGGAAEHGLISIRVGQHRVATNSKTFSDAPGETPSILVGSSGLVEIVVNRGNAAERLGAKVDDALEVEWNR